MAPQLVEVWVMLIYDILYALYIYTEYMTYLHIQYMSVYLCMSVYSIAYSCVLYTYIQCTINFISTLYLLYMYTSI